MAEFELRGLNDIEGREEAEVVENPVEGKESVDDDLNKSPVFVFGGLFDEFDDSGKFLDELGQPHELPRFLEMIYIVKDLRATL